MLQTFLRRAGTRPIVQVLATRSMATGTDQGGPEGVASKLKHIEEKVKHAAEEVVHDVLHPVETLHRVQHYVHEHREKAKEEAERGMYTADDFQEAAALAQEAYRQSHPQGKQGGLGHKIEDVAHKVGDAVHAAEHKVADAVHAAEHKVENVIHKVQKAVHDRKEHAHEEAERGMFTADDIREAAAQMAAAKGDKRIIEAAAKTEARLAQGDRPSESDEELLEDATQDWATDARQREIHGLQDAVKEESEK